MKARYESMLDGMLRAADQGPAEWSVYIVRCADETLYTGVAKDVEKRLAAHNAGRGAAYTRARRPVRLLHREDGLTRSQALVREAAIKAYPRSRKEELASPVEGPRRKKGESTP